MSKWKERIPGIVISVILVAVFAVFMVILLQSKMVPTKLLILGGIALVLLVASAVLLVRSIRNKGQFICGASLSLVLALVLFAPPVSLLLFLAVCGVFDALMPKTFPSIRPPRQ